MISYCHTHEDEIPEELSIDSEIFKLEYDLKEEKAKEYLEYINNHKLNVKKAWKILERNITLQYNSSGNVKGFFINDTDAYVIDGLIKTHDDSKLSDNEFYAYQAKFFPVPNAKYFTSNDKNFNLAWSHHIHNNPHHWEHWVIMDIVDSKPVTIPMNMPFHVIVEMVCDWFSMSMAFGGSTSEWYYEQKKKGNFLMTDFTIRIVEELVELCVE